MNTQKETIQSLSKKILSSNSFILTTHKNSDADGLGSILAFHQALKSVGKQSRPLSVDSVDPRYHFMKHQGILEIYDAQKTQLEKTDMTLVFDTSDSRLIEPLYKEIRKNCKNIVFIDHHTSKPHISSQDSCFIQKEASSTGEMCHSLFEEMKVTISEEIATFLYTSIVFDTHMFRNMKNSGKIFKTLSRIFHLVKSHNIYENIFCQYDQNVWEQMLQILKNVQYECCQQVAYIELGYNDFKNSQLKFFHLLDFLDLVMKRKSVLVGFLIVEISPGKYKLSLRGKESIDVVKVAEPLGGGGHSRSAGASLNQNLKKEILERVKELIQ